MRRGIVNLLLVVMVVALAALPLVVLKGAEFTGADAQAEAVIGEIKTGYEPWTEPLWQPPSSEIESLLFSLQAAAGAGFIGYYLGYVRGQKKRGPEG